MAIILFVLHNLHTRLYDCSMAQDNGRAHELVNFNTTKKGILRTVSFSSFFQALLSESTASLCHGGIGKGICVCVCMYIASTKEKGSGPMSWPCRPHWIISPPLAFRCLSPTHTHTHTHMHVCMYVYIYTYLYACMYVCMYILYAYIIHIYIYIYHI